MGIFAVLVLAFGIYLWVKRAQRREVPEETRELGARLGRSAHAAIPLPGLTGQSSEDLVSSGPIKDEIGTEEHHQIVVDTSPRPAPPVVKRRKAG